MNLKLMVFGMVVIFFSVVFLVSSELNKEVEIKEITPINNTLNDNNTYIEVSNTNLCEFMNAQIFNNTHCIK